MFALAEHLHITVSEVMQMSLTEFKGWLAYLNLKARKEKQNARNIRSRR